MDFSKMAESGKSAAEIAETILEQGYKLFIGNGLVIEQATRKGVWLDIGGKSYSPKYYSYRDAIIVLPISPLPAQTVAPQTDFISPDVSDAPPGSFTRLNDLATFYSEQTDTTGKSAFYISDARIAQRVAQALIELDEHAIIGDDVFASKHYRASTITD